MAVLDWISPESAFAIEGEQVRLRPPRGGDFAEWAELRRVSRSFLKPWEPTWPPDDLTRAAFRRRLSIDCRQSPGGRPTRGNLVGVDVLAVAALLRAGGGGECHRARAIGP